MSAESKHFMQKPQRDDFVTTLVQRLGLGTSAKKRVTARVSSLLEYCGPYDAHVAQALNCALDRERFNEVLDLIDASRKDRHGQYVHHIDWDKMESAVRKAYEKLDILYRSPRER